MVGGRRVLDWSLATARAQTDGVIVVVPADQAGAPEDGADIVVAGGPTRSASVRCGLVVVPGDVSHVLVHDAARPMAPPPLWRAVLDALGAGAEAVVPTIPVTDTIREIGGRTIDRQRFVVVQTPQGFQADLLRRAHAGDPEGTDDASLVEAAGGRVVLVPGDPANIKITTPKDLLLMGLLCP
jgi:2-C-methyl-D-erythritol 4-phosphate cytidylyltransferase